MKRTLLPALLLLLGPACDDSAESPSASLIDALPTSELFAIELPGDDDGDLGQVDAPLLGAPSGLRDLTSGVRKFLRLSLGGLLEHVERITSKEPLFESDERVVWRVSANDHSFEYGVVLEREGDGHGGHVRVNTWLRAPRPEAPQAPAEWRFLMAGRITPSPDGGSRGALWIDLDNDLKVKSRGKVMALWSQVDDHRVLEVVVFDGTPDDGEVSRITRTFRYEAGPDAGELAFDAGQIDVHLLADKPLKEHVRVVTRWNASGAMRADYAAGSMEVKADGYRVLLGSECWQAPNAAILYEQRLGLPLADGEAVPLFERGERSACPFPAQEAPIVPPPGAAPTPLERPTELDLSDRSNP